VTDAAVSLAASSQQVQESSAAQTDATTAVAAAVEQASVSVSETSINAQMAAEEVARARDDTTAAMRVMNEAVGNMREIAGLIETSSATVTGLSDASQRIGGIVQVIREIADQTCWLSMRPSKPRVPVSRAAALRWWRTRCASWPSVPARPLRRSAP
jgi:methyl-accepting chemotaxis protein